MPLIEFIPTAHLRDRLGAFPYPVDDMIETKNGKKIVCYTGRVVALYERNMAFDSEFYAVVYDDTLGLCKSICYRSAASYSTGDAKIDAREEIVELARDWLFWWHKRHLEYATDIMSMQLKAGRCVQFVKPYRPRNVGRLPVEVGSLAYIEKLIQNDFSRSGESDALIIYTNGPNIGLKAVHKLDKLVVFAPATYQRDPAEIERLARMRTAEENWQTPFSPLVYGSSI